MNTQMLDDELDSLRDSAFTLSRAVRIAGGAAPSAAERQTQALAEKALGPYVPRNGAVLVPPSGSVSCRMGASVRGLSSGGNGSGAVGSVKVMLPFGQALRAKSLVGRLGASILTGVDAIGSVCLPRFDPGSSVEWVGEFAEAGPSAVFLGGDYLSPRNAVAYTSLSNSLKANSDALDQVSDDLISGLATAIDAAVLRGAGPDFDEATGIIGREDIEVISLGTNGGPLTNQAILDAELALTSRGFETHDLAWVCSPKVRQAAKRTPKVEGYPVFLLDDASGTMNESPAFSHSELPDDLSKGSGAGLGSAILGDFRQVAIVIWGSIEVLVNKYSLDVTGISRVSAFLHVDFGLRQPGAFVVLKDILTAGS